MLSVRNTPYIYTIHPQVLPAPPAIETPQATFSSAPAPRAARMSQGIEHRLNAPTPVGTAESTVATRFASRPTVRLVVAGLLTEALKAQYQALDIDVTTTSLAVPSQAEPLQYELTPLLDLALDHLASGAELDFSDRHGVPCKWMDTAHYRFLKITDPTSHTPLPLDMHAVELAIRSVRPNLKAGFAEALSQYWGQNAFPQTRDAVPRASHWSWLSDTLQDTLRIAGIQQPGLDDAQRQTLDQVTRYPDAAERVPDPRHPA